MLSSTDRSLISSTGTAVAAAAERRVADVMSAPQPRVEDVAGPVADEIQRQRGEKNSDARKDDETGRLKDVRLARRDQATPHPHLWSGAEADVAERSHRDEDEPDVRRGPPAPRAG